MPHYPVVQPNGLFAIWTTVSDDFILFEATRQEVHNYFQGEAGGWPGGIPALTKTVDRYFAAIAQTGRAMAYAKTWREALWWVAYSKGPHAATFTTILQQGLISEEELKAILEEAYADLLRNNAIDPITEAEQEAVIMPSPRPDFWWKSTPKMKGGSFYVVCIGRDGNEQIDLFSLSELAAHLAGNTQDQPPAPARPRRA